MFKKVKVFLLFLILVSVVFATGCVSSLTADLGPKFTQAMTPESDKAIIYVYRERAVLSVTSNPGVIVNDTEVVKILPHLSYFSLSVEPGKYTFSPKLFGIYKTTEGIIEAQAGQVYYVRMSIPVGQIKFEQMHEDPASAGMEKCYKLDPKYYLDPRVVK